MKMHEYYTIKEAAELLKLSGSSIGVFCRGGYFPGACKFRGKWLIPRAGLESFYKGSATVFVGHRRLFFTGGILGAQKKLELIRKYYFWKDRLSKKSDLPEPAYVLACEKCSVPPRTMQRWLKLYDGLGLRGLIDKRGGSYKA